MTDADVRRYEALQEQAILFDAAWRQLEDADRVENNLLAAQQRAADAERTAAGLRVTVQVLEAVLVELLDALRWRRHDVAQAEADAWELLRDLAAEDAPGDVVEQAA